MIHPVEYRVVVRLDPVAEKVGSIFIPDESRERDQMAMTEATLVSASAMAFEDWKGTIPQPGDRVLIAKYAGTEPKAGDVGKSLLRICNDKDIVAVLR